MREIDIPTERIIVEKQSGKDFARPLYLQMVRCLKPGDVLVVKSIDRLGRNYDEILEQRANLTKEKRPLLLYWTCPGWIRGRAGT